MNENKTSNTNNIKNEKENNTMNENKTNYKNEWSYAPNMSKLFDKMSEEFEIYDQHLGFDKGEILQHAHEYALREDIFFSLYDHPLTEDEAAVLLKSETPLQDLVQAYEEAETDHMAVVRSMIKNYVNIKCGGDK